jgi:anti-sigma-K factor RskA
MSHTEYQELLAAYALDAIDARDGQALGEHLATCPQCREELAALRDATALLAHATKLEAPAEQVRAQILEKGRAKDGDGRAQILAMPQRARTAWPTLLRLAAAIAFVALLTGVIVLWRREARLKTEVAELSHELRSQRSELQKDRNTLAQQKEALAMLSSTTMKKVLLTGSQGAESARATLMFDERTGRAMLLTEGLPATSADKAYEVWFIPKGHAPMPGKVFSVDSSGHAMIMDQMPAEAMNNAVIAITIEPKNGSAAPTGAIYLASPAS